MKNRYKVSEEFKNSCKANIGLNRYGRIHVVEDDIDIVGENYNGQLVDFTIENNCYVNDTFVGTTVAKKITVNILNPDNLINLENKTIQAFVGIELNGELEEIPFGTYVIEKPENKEVIQKTSFTGYDNMIKFNVPYNNRVSYPIKASALLEDLCNQVGLEIGNEDFVNADYMILGNPFTNNEDCRTVLSNIAQLAGTFAKIGRDNKVYIITLKNIKNLLTVKYVDEMTVKELNLTEVKVLSGEADNTDETLDGMNYFEDFSKNEQWGGLNSLVLGISSIEGENTALDDKADIAENGLTEITIQDNYFLTDQAEREKVIVPIWNMLKGMKYLPFKTEYYGYPYLDVGDMIYIKDTKDNGYISYVFNHKFTFNGSFKGSLETKAITKTQQAYRNTFNIKSKFRRVERIVDKVNGRIEDIIEQQTKVGEKLSKHEQTIDSISDAVSSVETKLENDYSTTVEMNSLIDQRANSITSTVKETITEAKQDIIDDTNANIEDKMSNYYTKTETNSQISQSVDSITSTVTEIAKEEATDSANSAVNSKLGNYYTKSQTDSKISQTASSITSEVNKKVNNSEFGTKVQQSYSDIQIAWNKISSYIQFINSSLRIMDTSSRKLLQLDSYGLYLYDTDGSTSKMILNRYGQRFYESGEFVGLIGSQQLRSDNSKKGLTFSLDTRGSYMTWACLDNPGDSTYAMKFWYARPNTGNLHQGLCLGSDLVLNGYQMELENNNTHLTAWSNGGVGIYTYTRFCLCGGERDTYFEITPNENEKIQMYRTVNMNGYSIINAGNVSSDGRLKKNIYLSKINAIDRIKQMKLREFVWKKDSKQENIGYIAQELEKIDKTYVQHNYKEDEEGNVIEDSYELRHSPLIATNSKAIQEQQLIIEEQQETINRQQQFIEIVKDKLDLQEEYESIFNDTEVQLMSVEEDEEEVVFEGDVVMKTSKVLTPAPKYNTVMKYLDDNTVDIYQELAKDSEV